MIPNFRAWLKKEKEMIDVDEIHWYRGKFEFIGDGITFQRLADEVELMQSTGLFDKNGKEIYEGDVVQFEDCSKVSNFLYINTGIIEWYQGSFHLTNGNSVSMEDLVDGDLLDVTIIGNVWEDGDLIDGNPELLEDKE